MVRLPGIFKDHAVLQRDRKIWLWGEADIAGVCIRIYDEKKNVVSEQPAVVSEGYFKAEIGPFPAGGPYSISFTSDKTDCKEDSGEDHVCIRDIYFGDVYIAGGQSNMEFELKNSLNGHEEVESSNDPSIRFYYTPKVAWKGEELKKAEIESCWQSCTPGETACWSAVGYYFAKALSEELNRDTDDKLMIGIVGCNWGGTSASAWISRDKLLEYPETAVYVQNYDELTRGQSTEDYLKEFEEYTIYQAEFDRNVGNYYMTADNPTWDEAIRLFGENRYPGPMGPRNWTRPAGLYETMVRRIAPYGVCGVIWYQGEDDDNRPYGYKRLLTSLLEQWRTDFKYDDIPFYIVQLPVFVNEGEEDYKNWPFIREAQSEVCTENKGCGLAVILESGEYHNIHPLNKETAGYRLAFQALYRHYGIYGKWDACGPEYDSFELCGDRILIRIGCCDGGLVADCDDGFLQDICMYDHLPDDSGFEIAGEDKKYYPASAQLIPIQAAFDENSYEETADEEIFDKESFDEENADEECVLMLQLTSDKVKKPLFSRYFWKNYGKVRIFGANGIPLAPFRTDKNDGSVALGSRQGIIS